MPNIPICLFGGGTIGLLEGICFLQLEDDVLTRQSFVAGFYHGLIRQTFVSEAGHSLICLSSSEVNHF